MACNNSPRYFSQLVCELTHGHDGDHGDGEYTWEKD